MQILTEAFLQALNMSFTAGIVILCVCLARLALRRAPAVLREIGYHANTEDANWLTGNLDAVARAVSLGVTEYFGVPFLTPGDTFEAEAAGADGYLLLRSYPQTDAAVLAQLPNGTAVTVLGDFDNWYTVQAGDLYGFAPVSDVQLAVMPLN